MGVPTAASLLCFLAGSMNKRMNSARTKPFNTNDSLTGAVHSGPHAGLDLSLPLRRAPAVPRRLAVRARGRVVVVVVVVFVVVVVVVDDDDGDDDGE